jgi:hypothetical protein
MLGVLIGTESGRARTTRRTYRTRYSHNCASMQSFQAHQSSASKQNTQETHHPQPTKPHTPQTPSKRTVNRETHTSDLGGRGVYKAFVDFGFAFKQATGTLNHCLGGRTDDGCGGKSGLVLGFEPRLPLRQ